jgi:hypothetical protein
MTMNLRGHTSALRLETLEGREVPAPLQIVFDYRYDINGFFADPARRAILEQAGQDIASRLNSTVDLAPIVASGGNTWMPTIFNPSNPNQWLNVGNLNIGTDQMIVFVGAESGVGGGEAGLGGFGGYSASGSSDWFNLLRNRGRSGFAPWGGSISFNRATNWYFGTGTPGASQIDFYSVATHELGHVLGFGVSTQWTSLATGSNFVGSHARAANGGMNPQVSVTNPGHWQQGVTSNGQPVSMQPIIVAGTRVRFSELDFAALADLGWEVGAAGAPAPASPPAATSPPPSTSPILSSGQKPVVVGGSDGTFQVYTVTNGQLMPVGGPVTPFPGFLGNIRVASGDVNGDGVPDIVVAAGPGGGPVVKIYDGHSGTEIRSFFAYESYFGGGVLVAAGDFNGDGRDDVVVGADVGGGPRVRIFSAGNPAWEMADFWGIADSAFRGGARVAVGDINGDRRADLVVAAGPGGGPRIAIYDGATIRAGRLPDRLVWDFFAYDLGVNNGAYVAVGDVNGDGFGDVVFGPGVGSMHVQVISGAVLTQTNSGETALSRALTSYIIPQGAGYNSGARVAAGDFDGDGYAEVVVGTGAGIAGRMYLSDERGLTSLPVFGSVTQRDGVFVG